jgi:hypothetical protein
MWVGAALINSLFDQGGRVHFLGHGPDPGVAIG